MAKTKKKERVAHNKTDQKYVDYIVQSRNSGSSWDEVVTLFNKRFKLNKSKSAIVTLYRRNTKPEEQFNEIEAITAKNKLELETALAQYVMEHRRIPTIRDVSEKAGVDRNAINTYYRTYEKFIEAVKASYPESFESIIDESMFSEDTFESLREDIKNYKRFIVTSAVTGREVHEPSMRAIETFCEVRSAKLLVLPCSDPAAENEHKNKWTLSSRLNKDSIVFKDLQLNDSLMLSTIKMSAKQLQPLTGIKRLAQKKGSAIVASPKQFLEHATHSNNNNEIPRALLSCGAITEPVYKTVRYMSERTAMLAEMDHELGAVVVEIKDNKIFFMRTVLMDPETGSFIDIDTKYNADGTTEKVSAALLQTGDYHVLSTDPQAEQMAKDLVELTSPEYITFEDFFDGITINPHEEHDTISKSKKAKIGLLSLENELMACRDKINEVTNSWGNRNSKIVMKYGNHEDFLLRWIKKGEFMKDPINKILGMKLTIAYEELGINPFEYAMTVLYKIDHPERVRFLGINDSFKVGKIENGAHGHLGKAGRRNPTMAELEECYGAANVGHNHSAAKFRSIVRAGTSTKLQLSYNHGASGWTQSHVLQHKDNSRQIITNIFGEWRLID